MLTLAELTATDNWLEELTETVSVPSVIFIGHALPMPVGVDWITEAVRVFEIDALSALVTTTEPEDTITEGELEMLAVTVFVTTAEPVI